MPGSSRRRRGLVPEGLGRIPDGLPRLSEPLPDGDVQPRLSGRLRARSTATPPACANGSSSPNPATRPRPADGAPLISIESQRPLADFDMIAFSLSFENDYPQILRILEMAGIPLEAADRGERRSARHRRRHRRHAEPRTPRRLLRSLPPRRGRSGSPRISRSGDLPSERDLPREAILARIQKEIAGAYVPRFYRVTTGEDGRISAREPLDPAFPRRIVRPWVPDLDAFATEQEITTKETEFGGMFVTEVSRGCGRGCRFCAAGFVFRPVRFRSGAVAGPLLPAGTRKTEDDRSSGNGRLGPPRLLPSAAPSSTRGGRVGGRIPPPGPVQRRNGGDPQGNRRGNRLARPRGGLPAPPGCDPQGDHRRGDFFCCGKT